MTVEIMVMIAPLVIFPLLYNFTFHNQLSTILAQKFRPHQGKIPESFDARKNWPECKSISRIANQGECRTSWALSGVMTMSDRLCIYTSSIDQFEFSTQEVLNCCDDCFDPDDNPPRCNSSGDSSRALYFLVHEGASSEECYPYNWTTIGTGCEQSCKEKRRATTLVSSSEDSDLRDVQYEIMTNGPVVSFMRVDLKFQDEGGRNQVFEEKGLYRKPPRDKHAVRVLGWGVQGQVPYWLVANTWGKEWGLEGGFFKVHRGNNNFGIEELFIAAVFDNPTERDIPTNLAFATDRTEIFIIMIVIFCIYRLFF